MTDEELNALVEKMDGMGRIDGVLTMSLTTIIAVEDAQAAASAIRQLMEELRQARIAGAWLYGLELERPDDYAEQKRLAMHACRLAFRHPLALS